MNLKRLPPDDPREWLRRANSNLNRARAFTADTCLEDSCFDAQQATEKAVKAVFVCRGEQFFLSFTNFNASCNAWKEMV
ncbi:MAG: HEPN domain-containing protein [Planctomycetota bacterium]|nr:HEPN domain-containing protein [Planctomycetota bacterium]